MSERISTVEDVLAIFAMADQIKAAGNDPRPLQLAAFDELEPDYGAPFGRSLTHVWADACVAYDRMHGVVFEGDE